MRATILATVLLWSIPALAQEPALPQAPQPAPTRDVRWDRVEDLLPGETIELRERTDRVPTACVLDDTTDTTLVCEIAMRRRPLRRVVFPQAAVDRVWVTRLVHGPSGRVLLIAAGVGAAFGGFAGASAGGGQAAAGAAVGALIGAGMASISDPLGLPVRTKRWLIYSAP